MKNSELFSKICLSCMECCKSIGVFSIHPFNEEVKEFYETRGAKVTPRPINPNMVVSFVEFDFPCPHLDKEKGCLIYDTRPNVCREYPMDGNQIMEKCELHKRGLL